MDQNTAHPLSGILLFEARMPIVWHRLNDPLPRGSLARRQERNERLLQALNLGESHRPDSGDDDHELGSALLRLEMKLDMALDMLSALARTQNLLPQARDVRLSAKGLGWLLTTDEIAPAEGDWVEIGLSMDPHFPHTLELTGRVEEIHPKSGSHEVIVSFVDLGEKVEEALTRYIFLQHRHQVAMEKGG